MLWGKRIGRLENEDLCILAEGGVAFPQVTCRGGQFSPPLGQKESEAV